MHDARKPRINHPFLSSPLIPLIQLSHFIILSLSLAENEVAVSKDNPYFAPDQDFVSGKVVEYLSDPIFYDTYIPLIFVVPVPKHTEKALKLIWGDVQSCSNTKSGKLCPVAYHLFKVIKKLGDDMGFWKPYYANYTAKNNESAKKRSGFEVICNEISSHFFRSYTSKAQLESYLKAMRACSRFGKHIRLRKSSESWVVDKAVYYSMLESFKIEYFNDLPLEGKVDWAITLNAYTSVHGILLTNSVLESVRLSSALRICQSGLIPETFISMDMLRDAIRNASQSLSRWGYDLVYPDLEHDLEEYYKLPLADCTFSDEYTFYVRILVPVRRKDVYYKLVQITTIPFLEKLSNTSGIPERLCRLKLFASKLTLIETNAGLLLDTHCEANQLCKTSEVSTVFENDACTSSLLTDNRQLITNACKFSCFSVDPVALPLIRRIASDTYIVVGSSENKILINCYDKPEDMIPVPMKNVGAMRIRLACNCHLLYSNHVAYTPREPCARKTIVEHILPYHWYNRNLNVTLVDKYVLEQGNATKPNDSIEFIGGIDEEQIEKSIAKQEEELEKEFQFVPKVHPNKMASDGMSDGLTVQLCILWTLVIILCLTMLYIGHQLRKLTKWKNLQAYKETRILYSIPETPDENKMIVNKF